jgi:Spy/CpxP family protein refolding chaperone
MDPGGMRPGFGPPLPGFRGPGPGDFERLGLTDAQRSKLANLRDDELRKVIRIDADLQIAELDLLGIVRGEHPDLQTIEAQIDRISALHAGIAKARIGGMIAARSVLTAEQRAKLRPPPGDPGDGPGAMPERPSRP